MGATTILPWARCVSTLLDGFNPYIQARLSAHVSSANWLLPPIPIQRHKRCQAAPRNDDTKDGNHLLCPSQCDSGKDFPPLDVFNKIRGPAPSDLEFPLNTGNADTVFIQKSRRCPYFLSRKSNGRSCRRCTSIEGAQTGSLNSWSNVCIHHSTYPQRGNCCSMTDGITAFFIPLEQSPQTH